ncbi:MAG: aminodeoxychorismate/anthranilate synthase component II, partial [Deltaproteobacteria bacterium]|nr:aminodeoxychorismate/anthranilate synthase component II [Deltaproteobacteria bacterium]
GLPVVRAPRIMRGRTSPVEHDGRGLFSGLPQPMKVGRYHWLLAKEPGPKVVHPVEITARTPAQIKLAVI